MPVCRLVRKSCRPSNNSTLEHQLISKTKAAGTRPTALFKLERLRSLMQSRLYATLIHVAKIGTFLLSTKFFCSFFQFLLHFSFTSLLFSPILTKWGHNQIPLSSSREGRTVYSIQFSQKAFVCPDLAHSQPVISSISKCKEICFPALFSFFLRIAWRFVCDQGTVPWSVPWSVRSTRNYKGWI